MPRPPARSYILSTPVGSYCLSRPDGPNAGGEAVTDPWTLRCVAHFATCQVEIRDGELGKFLNSVGDGIPSDPYGAERWLEGEIVGGGVAVSKIPPPAPGGNLPSKAKVEALGPKPQEAPPSAAKPPPPPKPVTTCFNTLTISCAHTKPAKSITAPESRTHKLVLPLPANSKKTHEYHVVSGHTKADDILLVLGGGPCSHGKDDISHITVSGAQVAMGDDGLAFKAFAPKVALLNPFDWADILWPLDSTPKQYTVTPKFCEGNSGASAIVKAYPYVKWELSLTISLGDRSTGGTYGAELPDGKVDVERYVQYQKKKTGWGIGGDAKITLDNGHFTKNLTKEFEQYTQNAFKVMASFKDFSDTLKGFVASTGCGEFTLTLPKLKLVYELETTEDKADHALDFTGKASIKLDPLIQIAYKFDVLNWVIGICLNGVCPGLGSALVKIKARAEKGFGSGNLKVSVKLSVDMTFKGTIAGEVSWERKRKEGKWSSPKGKISAGVTGEIRAIARGTADLWICSLYAGAEAGAKIGFGYDVVSGSDGAGLFVQGQLRFDGIVLDYVVYHGSGRISKPPKSQTTDGGDGRTYKQTDVSEGKTGGESRNIDSEGKAVLMKPRYWPEISKVGKHYIIRNRP